MEEGSRAALVFHVAVGMAVAIARLGAVKGFESSPMNFLELGPEHIRVIAPRIEVGVGRQELALWGNI